MAPMLFVGNTARFSGSTAQTQLEGFIIDERPASPPDSYYSQQQRFRWGSGKVRGGVLVGGARAPLFVGSGLNGVSALGKGCQ